LPRRQVLRRSPKQTKTDGRHMGNATYVSGHVEVAVFGLMRLRDVATAFYLCTRVARCRRDAGTVNPSDSATLTFTSASKPSSLTSGSSDAVAVPLSN
jgi:hypothetical protein